MNNKTAVVWDWGTAYDLFCSLRVLHEPGHYGLRPSWAAGVRSRIPAVPREFLERVHQFLFIPKTWIFGLSQSKGDTLKDGDAVLWSLSQLPPAERLLTLVEGSGVSQTVMGILKQVVQQRNFTARDQEKLREALPSERIKSRSKAISSFLGLFSQPEESGTRYLAALKAYQRLFFAEEEERIFPYLNQAVAEAQALASQLQLEDLIEALSRGVRIGVDSTITQWIFVPSYWISPLVSFDRLDDGTAFFIYGGRPADVSLVPGEMVPEGMLRAFKALGDSTRLRILKYLTQEDEINLSEIARRLRLRAPTVTHHLNVLRLAGLVKLTLKEGNERHYEARKEAIQEMFAVFNDFLIEKDDLDLE